MARRRRSAGGGCLWGILAFAVLDGLIVAAVEHHGLAALAALGVVVGIGWYVRREKRRRERKASVAKAAAVKAMSEAESEALAQAWRETPFGSGRFTVMFSAGRWDMHSLTSTDQLRSFIRNLHSFQGMAESEVDELIERAEHVAPQVLAQGIDQASAVRLKVQLEEFEAKVKIIEGPAAKAGGGRQPIPERVRHEVWRRDDGRCVDCGSRERLEFDHIVPVSKGGANTARNIELRCESCNRKKAAKI